MTTSINDLFLELLMVVQYLQFVLPFVTIIMCYTAIIRKLGQRSASRPGKYENQIMSGLLLIPEQISQQLAP